MKTSLPGKLGLKSEVIFFFGVLYEARNYIFNISPSSKRKMLPGNYRKNIEALEALFKSAQLNNINVIAYIAPFPSEENNPYDQKEYYQFKDDSRAIARSTGVILYNFEDLIPLNKWGYKAGTSFGVEKERDFMHFQHKGHEILAESLFNILIEEDLISN